MSAEIVLLAALFLAVPITAKCVTAFEIRGLMDGLRRREREIERLYAHLDAIEQEREVIEGAVLQVYERRRWSATRRDLMAEELQRARRRRPRAARADDRPLGPHTPPVWQPENAAQAAA